MIYAPYLNDLRAPSDLGFRTVVTTHHDVTEVGIGAYGAAKLGQYELHSACEQCGRKITIQRTATD